MYSESAEANVTTSSVADGCSLDHDHPSAATTPSSNTPVLVAATMTVPASSTSNRCMADLGDTTAGSITSDAAAGSAVTEGSSR